MEIITIIDTHPHSCHICEIPKDKDIEFQRVEILALMAYIPHDYIIDARINSEEWIRLSHAANYLDDYIKKVIAADCQTKKN